MDNLEYEEGLDLLCKNAFGCSLKDCEAVIDEAKEEALKDTHQ